MNTMKIVGATAGGLTLVALIGAGLFWAYRWKQKQEGSSPQPGPVPSNPPRPAPVPPDHNPDAIFVGKGEVHPELDEILDERFPDAWPPDDETVNALTKEDVIIFAVESKEVGNYTETQQELITAKVLSVEKTVVRGRVVAPVAHAEHHGSHAGHGFRVGDLVEVPRSKILVAARSTDPKKEGYNAEGKAAQTFKSSHMTKQVYRVRPGTPYDLVLPYRTKEIEWYVDRELVTMTKIGDNGLLEQVMFTEGSMRGEVSVRALDNDPETGKIFVARWDFNIQP